LRLLITGSNGFVGGSFGRFAVRAGHEVLGVGRASQPLRAWPGAYAQADAASADLSPLVRDFAPDVLFHAAGTASVAASLDAPLQDLRASVLSFANVLEAVRRSGASPFVLFPSSAAVYGDPARLPVGEDAPVRPISPYGFHKAACELVAREYADCFGVRVAICRLFSVFGAAQRRLLVWELYNQFAGAGETVWLAGTGEETRDYLHIDDAAAALLQLAAAQLAARDSAGADFITVNVASGEATRVASLAAQIRALVAPTKEIRTRGGARPGDPKAWRADLTRLRALIPAWQPAPLTDSLARCVVEWRAESS
jgi:UDP-glucose 4-epimerase